jgi:hypothetical protein
MIKIMVFVASGAILFIAGAAAQAGTLTFYGMIDSYFFYSDYLTWSEDGFEVQTFGDLGGPESLHVDVLGGPYGLLYLITRPDMALFDLLSLAVNPLNDFSSLFPGDMQADLKIEGYRDGALVSSTSASSQNGGEVFVADASFVMLDELRVQGMIASNMAIRQAATPGTVHFLIDDISLSLSQTLVPLPGAAAMLAFAARCCKPDKARV